MEARRRLLMRKKSRLPSEYQEVECIKTEEYWGTRNQFKAFICTGLSLASIKKIICSYQILSYAPGNTKYSPIMIASYSTGKTTPEDPWASPSEVVGFESINPTYVRPYPENKIEYTILLTKQSTKYLRIGGWSDVSFTAAGAYYYVYVYGENDVVLAKYIPCYRKIDSKPGMYELINGVFYPSDGSEEFIAGPEV